jgi:hypothetical protein
MAGAQANFVYHAIEDKDWRVLPRSSSLYLLFRIAARLSVSALRDFSA